MTFYSFVFMLTIITVYFILTILYFILPMTFDILMTFYFIIFLFELYTYNNILFYFNCNNIILVLAFLFFKL